MGLILEGSQPLLPAAASGTVTSTDITDSTAAGRSLLTAATTAAQRAALCDRTISIPGLTATQGTGTAVAASGTLSYASGQTAGAYADFPRLIGAHGGSVWSFDVACRITLTGAPSVNTIACVGLGTTGTDYECVAMMRLWGNGQVDGLAMAGTATWSGPGAGTLALDGTGWLRVRCQGGVLSFWTGVGATYAAAEWILRDRRLMVVPTLADSAYPSLAVTLYQATDPGAPGVAAVFADLTVRDLP